MLALVLTACGGQPASTSATATPHRLGAYEGSVRVLVHPDDLEDASVDDFEHDTGCRVRTHDYGSPEEALRLFSSGAYDVGSLPGEASSAAITDGSAAALNTDLLRHYSHLFPYLQDRDWNTRGGDVYGVPRGYDTTLLLYATTPAPTSWQAVYEPTPTQRGRIAVHDSPMVIAEAALYLMRHRPELDIRNPYALDRSQLDAAVALLRAQQPYVGLRWTDPSSAQKAFESGQVVLGAGDRTTAEAAHVKAAFPEEGTIATGDSWLISSRAASPSCAYAWIDHLLDPKVDAKVSEHAGLTPVSEDACALVSAGYCEARHAGDETYADRTWFWTTPTADCVDGRTTVRCTTYADWVHAWSEARRPVAHP